MEHESENFDFEFSNMVGELGDTEEQLRREAATRLNKLMEGHTDITGAAIALEREDKQATTGYLIRARVVAYTRPDDIAGVEKDDNALGALKGALSKVERQVREKRDKLRETWKQPKNQEEIGAIEGIDQLPPQANAKPIEGYDPYEMDAEEFSDEGQDQTRSDE